MKSENTLQKLIHFLFGDPSMAKTNSQAVRVPNYIDAMVASMIATYEANPSLDTVAALATSMGKNKRSIIAKLVREGVYKAQPRVTKAGAPIVRKAELVAQIQTHFGITVPSFKFEEEKLTVTGESGLEVKRTSKKPWSPSSLVNKSISVIRILDSSSSIVTTFID